MSGEVIEIEYEITMEDAVAFSLWDWKRSMEYKKRTGVILLLSALIGGLVYLLLWMTHFAAWSVFFSGFCSGVVGLAFYMLAIMPSVTKQTVEKKMGDCRNAVLITRHKTRFDAQGIDTQTAVSHTKVSWGGVEKVRRGPDAAYLYLTGMMAFIIPARAFSDAASFDAFYALCERYFEAARAADGEEGAGA